MTAAASLWTCPGGALAPPQRYQQPAGQSTVVAVMPVLTFSPVPADRVAYAAHRVVNSRWITNAKRINSVHPNHQGGWQDRLNHYVFCFPDETFECLAEGFTTDRSVASPRAILSELADRLLGRPGPAEDPFDRYRAMTRGRPDQYVATVLRSVAPQSLLGHRRSP